MLTNNEKIELTAHACIALVLCIQAFFVVFKLAGVIEWGWIFVMLPLLIASVIVDPFGGSGTTAVACQELGRDCDIYEISRDYCDIISNRLKKNAWQIKL